MSHLFLSRLLVAWLGFRGYRIWQGDNIASILALDHMAIIRMLHRGEITLEFYKALKNEKRSMHTDFVNREVSV